MHMLKTILTIIGVAWMVGCSGKTSLLVSHDQPYVVSERLNRGLVIALPGIEGRSKLNEDICRGLDEGGVSWAIELYDWTSDRKSVV